MLVRFWAPQEVEVAHALLYGIFEAEGIQLLQRWLREVDASNASGNASIPDRLSILREIGSATDARDKCLK